MSRWIQQNVVRPSPVRVASYWNLSSPVFRIEPTYLEAMGTLGPHVVYGPVSEGRVHEQQLMSRIRWRLERPRRVLPLPT